jgi:hypothetical protein
MDDDGCPGAEVCVREFLFRDLYNGNPLAFVRPQMWTMSLRQGWTGPPVWIRRLPCPSRRVRPTGPNCGAGQVARVQRSCRARPLYSSAGASLFGSFPSNAETTKNHDACDSREEAGNCINGDKMLADVDPSPSGAFAIAADIVGPQTKPI